LEFGGRVGKRSIIILCCKALLEKATQNGAGHVAAANEGQACLFEFGDGCGRHARIVSFSPGCFGYLVAMTTSLHLIKAPPARGRCCSIAKASPWPLHNKNSRSTFPNRLGWNTMPWKFGTPKDPVMQKVVNQAGINAQQVQAIGITNQRETTVVWDPRLVSPLHRPSCGKTDEQRLFASV